MADRRLLEISYPHDPPDYMGGSMFSVQLEHVPTIVLQDLEMAIKAELTDRARVKMLVREATGPQLLELSRSVRDLEREGERARARSG